MKKYKILKNGFTLVELIIVITILAILAVIAFFSFHGYIKTSRDSNRVTTVSNIEKGLNLYQVKTGNYPTPEIINGTGYLHNNSNELVYVGNIENELVRKINMNTVPLDPLYKKNYIYGISYDKRFFQIASIFENLQANTNLPGIGNVYANENITAYVKGNYNKILPYTFEGENCISNIPSLIFNTQGITDLSNENIGYIINKSSNTPYQLSGQALIPTSEILKSISSTGSVGNVCSAYIKKQDNFSQIKEELENTLGYEIDEIGPTLFPDYIPIGNSSGSSNGNGENGTGNGNNPGDNSIIIPSGPFNQCDTYDNTSNGFAGGDGTQNNPYLICNAEQLAYINSNTSILTAGNYYKLVSNIDISGYNNWTPIGNGTEPFIGFFDGNNLTIQGLNINNPSLGEVGLFGVVINGSFKDLNIIAGDIIGTSYVGTLAGVFTPGNAHNVKVETNNISGGNYVGGLVGMITSGDISDVSVHINNNLLGITSDIGGIVGIMMNGNISDSSSYIGNNIQGQDSVGGLVGMFQNGNISDSSSYIGNNIQGRDMVGGWVGHYMNGGILNNVSSEVKNIITNGSYIGGLIGFYNQSSNIINSSSKLNDIITEGSQTHIGGLIGYINNTASITNSHSELNNITGSGNIVGGLVGRTNGNITSSYSKGNNIIGTDELGGLSGWMEENSIITDSYSIYNDIIGTNGLGGFIGRADGKIENSYSTVRHITGNERLGGFIGATYSDTKEITNSYSQTNNISGGNDVGGFIGVGYDNGTISFSHSITQNINGNERVAGFIGSQFGSNPQIYSSYAKSNDITGVKHIGGFIGWTTSTIKNSYTIAGNISGENYIGGFVGENQSSGLIENSYVQALNIIGSGDYIAGFAGVNWAKIKNSYSYITGLSSPGKKAAFVGNSFTSVENSFIHTFSGHENIHYFEEYTGSGISGYWNEIVWVIDDDPINSANDPSNLYGKQNLTALTFLQNTNWDTEIWGHTGGKNNNLPYLKSFE